MPVAPPTPATFREEIPVKNHESALAAIKESMATGRAANCRCCEANYERLSAEATSWWIDDEVLYFTFVDERTLSGWTVYTHSSLDSHLAALFAPST